MKTEALCFVLEELKPRGAMRAMKNMRRRELPSIFSDGFFPWWWEEGAKYASAFFYWPDPLHFTFSKEGFALAPKVPEKPFEPAL